MKQNQNTQNDVPAISSQVSFEKVGSVIHGVHLGISAEELKTASRNNLRGITLVGKPI